MVIPRQIFRSQNYCALAIALVVITSSTSAQAQQTGGTGGGNTGGGTTGGASGTGNVSGLQDSNAIFADGVTRSGPVVQSQIGAAPGNTGGTSTTTAGGGRSSGGLFGGLGGLGGLGGFGGLNSLFGGNQQTQRSVRTRLISRITTPSVTPLAVQSRVQTTFSRIAAKPRFSGIRIEMDGETTVLVGSVANADDKRMATLLAQLEPGVREVRNELDIAP